MITFKDKVWFEVAQVISKLSKCQKGGTGAVIVSADGRLVGSGYTGHPHGWNDEVCDRQGIASNTCYDSNGLGLHAELNAILHTAYLDRQLGTLYSSRALCRQCALQASQAGIKRIVCPDDLPSVKGTRYSGLDLLRENDTTIRIDIIE